MRAAGGVGGGGKKQGALPLAPLRGTSCPHEPSSDCQRGCTMVVVMPYWCPYWCTPPHPVPFPMVPHTYSRWVYARHPQRWQPQPQPAPEHGPVAEGVSNESCHRHVGQQHKLLDQLVGLLRCGRRGGTEVRCIPGGVGVEEGVLCGEGKGRQREEDVGDLRNTTERRMRHWWCVVLQPTAAPPPRPHTGTAPPSHPSSLTPPRCQAACQPPPTPGPAAREDVPSPRPSLALQLLQVWRPACTSPLVTQGQKLAPETPPTHLLHVRRPAGTSPAPLRPSREQARKRNPKCSSKRCARTFCTYGAPSVGLPSASSLK